MKFPAFEPIDLLNEKETTKIIDLCLTQITVDKNQPRKYFDKDSLADLAASIRMHGVIQPIIVVKVENSDKYQIIAGERRYRAAKIAGIDKVPAIIREYDKIKKMTVALIENIQRANLNPLEEAQAIESLLKDCSMTHVQVAETIGRSRSTVSNLLRLLCLENEVKLMFNTGLIEMGHGRALLSLEKEDQIEAAKLIINKSMSVREAEKYINTYKNQAKKQKPMLEFDFEIKRKVKNWQRALAQKISSKFELNLDSAGKGKLVIYFRTANEVDTLIEHLTLKGNKE